MGRKNQISQMWTDYYVDLKAYVDEAISKANKDNYKKYYHGLEFRMRQLEKHLIDRNCSMMDKQLLLYMLIAVSDSTCVLKRKIINRDDWTVDWSTCEKIISRNVN